MERDEFGFERAAERFSHCVIILGVARSPFLMHRTPDRRACEAQSASHNRSGAFAAMSCLARSGNNAMKGVDAVVHLAAMWLLYCKDYPRTAFGANINGTFDVLEVCVNNNTERLVYSSSASVYGDAVEIPITESHPFDNRHFYGATKVLVKPCVAMTG